MNLRIAVASSSLLATPLIESIQESDDELGGLITVPDAPKGRGRSSTESELAIWSGERGFLLEKYQSDDELRAFLTEHRIDLVITLSFGKIIPTELLAIPNYGWLNVHFSALPKYRGAAPVQRSILAGEESIGISVFQLDSGMDTGPVYTQAEFPLGRTATTESILSDLSIAAVPLVREALQSIRHGESPSPQPEGVATYAAKLNLDEGRINWRSHGDQILLLLRALQENVGTWSTFREGKINFYGATFVRENPEAEPGRIIISGAKNEPLTIACGDGVIVIDEVKPAGKNRMSSSDFLRGARVENESLI